MHTKKKYIKTTNNAGMQAHYVKKKKKKPLLQHKFVKFNNH